MTAEVLGTANQEAPEREAPWIPDDSTFGARLALIRQRMGWGNVKEAAVACGLPPESWRTWERDNVSPQKYPMICRKIAERVGCDLFWLMDGSGRGSTEHKFDFAPAPVRPIDNRPARGPRKGGDRDAARRPVRIRSLLTSTDLRSAA